MLETLVVNPSQTSGSSAKGATMAYEAIVATYLGGMMRIWAARASQLSLELALVHLNATTAGTQPMPTEYADVIQELRAIEFRDYDAWTYVGNFGQLIYATTLLDSFLSDTTRFMFLLLPASIGKAQGITVNDIVAAESTTDLLKRAIEKRAREVSFLGFLERIDFLAKQYGLEINLPDDARSSLEHYAGIRNVVIHDQGSIDLVRTPAGDMKGIRKACPVHPRRVSGAEIAGATRAYCRVASHVATAVVRDVLKEPLPESVKVLEERASAASVASTR